MEKSRNTVEKNIVKDNDGSIYKISKFRTVSGNLANEVESGKVLAHGRAEGNIHVTVREEEIHEEINVRIEIAFINFAFN